MRQIVYGLSRVLVPSQLRPLLAVLAAETIAPNKTVKAEQASTSLECSLVIKGGGGLVPANASGLIESASINCVRKGSSMKQPLPGSFHPALLRRLAAGSVNNVACPQPAVTVNLQCLLVLCGNVSVMFTRSSITGVQVPEMDGLLCMWGASKAEFVNSRFSGNRALTGGVMHLRQNATVTLASSSLLNNKARLPDGVDEPFGFPHPNPGA